MIYVNKNESGQVMDLCFHEKLGFEQASMFDNEVKTYVQNPDNQDRIKDIISVLDLDMVRITEDLIEVLIQKEIILFTDFPEAVQNKLLFKRLLRQVLSNKKTNSLYDDNEGIQFD